jgi:chemotaxis protein MotB
MNKMKNSLRYFTFLALIAGLLFTSCVSNKKFTASETRANKLQKENANNLSQLNDCNNQITAMKDDKATMQRNNEILQTEYSEIQNSMLISSTESKMTIAEQAKRLAHLQRIIHNQRERADNLKNSISKALMNYKTDELNVYQKDGKVYVSLAEKLLFKSGSDVVDPKGKAALKTLADVLNSSKDFTVAIEGHTDDVPIKTKMFEDNWDLSTARASSIVRVLTKDNGFDSSRITASGRSEYHPVSVNTTAEGRADNRRTEVILSPDLQEIYKLLYQ